MTIKSDRWIRRMAQDHRMIEPFEPSQVKTVEGRKVVSYGTSSYGYDIRCSTEFKIFTNINSTIVDPKAFDERNFVDYRAVCASSRRTRSRWPVPWSSFASRGTGSPSALGSPPTGPWAIFLT